MATAPQIPMSIEEVSADWLTAALQHGGHTVEVETAEHRGVLGGNATKVKVHATYDRPTDLPADLFIKVGMELQDPGKNMTGSTYDIEGRFFLLVRRLLPECQAPRCFAVLIDEATSRCALVLEDLVAPGGTFGSPLARSLEVHEALDLLRQLATLHGRWWDGREQMPIRGLDHGIDRGNRLGRYYSRFDVDYLSRLMQGSRGAALPAGVRDPERLERSFWANAQLALGCRRSIIHADPHLGNIFVRADGRAGLADWQTLRWGHWAHDVSYLVTSTLTVPDRRGAEDELLGYYLDWLHREGGERLDVGAAKEAFARSLIYGLVGWLTAPTYFGYPEEYSNAYACRFAEAALDNGTLDLLSDA